MRFTTPKPVRRLNTHSPILLIIPFLLPTLLLFVPFPSLPSLPTRSTPSTPPPPPANTLPYYTYPLPPNYTSPTHCILYDRPPHTASTTISQAITKCLNSHNYATTTLPFDAVPPNQTISDLIFNHSTTHRAATHNHLSISPADIFLLRLLCSPNLFYITSTRTMPARITSSAKYVLTPTHTSSSLSASQFQKAMHIAKGDHVNEKRLEHYPFDDQNVTLTPDYVIRHSSLHDDLTLLLRAMKCDPAFETLNVHRGVHQEESKRQQRTTRDALQLHFGDARHRALTRLADLVNQRGLQKLGAFFARP